MPDKADYEQVPDVEQAAGPALPEPTVDPRETYPEADALQAKLLGYLDEVIKLPNPQVQLPFVQVRQVEGAPTTLGDLLAAIKLPTAVFIGTVVTAVLAIVSGSEIAQMLFPYIACIAAFIGMVPSLKERFTKQSDRAFETLDKTEASIEGRVDAVTFEVQFLVDRIQEMVDEVIRPIRPKLDAASKAETVLKKIDDSIDIPDPSDMERELDGCADQVNDKMDQVKGLLNFRKCIPIAFRTKENFTKFEIYPLLAIYLALQIYGVYRTSQMHEKADGENGEEVTRYLRGNAQAVVRQLQAGNVTSTTTESTDGSLFSNVDWYPMWVSLQTYVTSLVQLVIGFLLSQAAVIAGFINIAIARVNNEANRALDTTGATKVFDEYLTTKMETVRKQMLNLISTMIKIDNATERAGSALKVDIPDSVQDVADSIKEQMDKKQGFQFPWSPFGKKK